MTTPDRAALLAAMTDPHQIAHECARRSSGPFTSTPTDESSAFFATVPAQLSPDC